MRKGFANSTSSRWNADASELISSWPSKFSKEKWILTSLNSSSAHPEPVYEGTPTDYCKDQPVFDAFSIRIVKYWNRLPADLALAPSVSIFKKQLGRHWFEIFPAAPVKLLSPFIDNFLNTVITDY